MTDPLDTLNDIEDVFPLTDAQAGMLFESLARPGDGVYNGTIAADLPPELDLPRFKTAWANVVERHQCLRSLILWEGLDQPVQVVQNAGDFCWHEEDWSAFSYRDGHARLDAFLGRAQQDAPDFSKARSLLRPALLKMPGGVYRFVLSCHHALLDNWSVETLLTEIEHLYREGTPLSSPVPYRDFVDWLGTQNADATNRHWQKTLRGLSGPTRLAFANPGTTTNARWETDIRLDQDVSDVLRRAATDLRTTLGTILATVWGVVTHRLSDTDDALFGLAVTQRPPDLTGIEGAVGNFVTTLPVRVDLSRDITLRDLVLDLQATRALDGSYCTTGLSRLPALVGTPACTPLFDTVLSIEQAKTVEAVDHTPLFNAIQVCDRSEFPLSIFAIVGDKITLRAQSDQSHLSPTDARTALEAFEAALIAVPDCLDRLARDMPVMAQAKHTLALQGDHGPALTSEPDLWLAQFERVMQTHSDTVAILSGDQTITYGALRTRVETFQAALHRADVQPNTFVAICLEDPAETIAAMIAVWRMGCAYVPLSSQEPGERLAAKLATLECERVIADPVTQAVLPHTIRAVLLGDAPQGHLPPAPSKGGDPAYVIFTSGSTGVPKGVVITHANLSASNAARVAWYGETPGRFLLVSPLIFDSSVAGLYWTLAGAGTLVIPDSETLRRPSALAALVSDTQTTHTLCLPSLYEILLETGRGENLASFETVIVAGEPVPSSLVKRHQDKTRDTRLVNEYGPTEATVWCSVSRLDDGDGSSPIGGPIPGGFLILRDRYGRTVPTGLPAELYAGGPGIAAGYVGLDKETKARFVTDPALPDTRLYRTGDLVRKRPHDGQLEFLGRADAQLKIRGHRVEPAEIEIAIAERSGVAAAAVVQTTGAARPELVAYLVLEPTAVIDPSAVQADMAAILPDYMQPARYVVLDDLPVTQTGKVDRRNLAERPIAALPAQTLDTPATVTETRLVGIWAEALDISDADLGVTDPFYSVGGDSLAAMRLVGRVAEAFKIDLSVAELLASGLTIRGMANLVDQRTGQCIPDRTPVTPLSFPVPVPEGLKTLWLAARFHPRKPFLNLDTAARLTSVPGPGALKNAARALAEKHGSLQLGFALEDGALGLVPRRHPPEIHEDRMTGATRAQIEEWLADLVSLPFDVEDGPLWRCGLLEIGPDDAVLALVTHHTISDGWSLDVLMRDLVAHVMGQTILPDQSAWDPHAFARQISDHHDGCREGDIGFWRNHLAGVAKPARIPTDNPLPRIASPEGHEARHPIGSDTEVALRAYCKAHGTTLLPMLWASISALMWARSGTADTLVAISQANRGSSRLIDAVGCFTQPLPYRLAIAGDMTFETVFRTARTFCDEARNHDQVPVERVIEALPKAHQTYLSSFTQMALQINDFSEAGWHGRTDLKAEPFSRPATITSLFEISVEWRRGENGLECGMLGRADLFSPQTIADLLKEYLACLQAAISDPAEPLAALLQRND